VTTQKLILASASPRRRELLQQLGADFRCLPADIDETPRPGEEPRDYVQRMASEKARAVREQLGAGSWQVLGADTTVVIDGDILGKPADHFEGLAMLARLSGRSHQVHTALSLLGEQDEQHNIVTTDVAFTTLDRSQCEAYLATDEPWDKAGGYGIQGLGGAFVRGISGSYTNVVGLPLHETWLMLSAAGVATALENGNV
jgi:septum formation protein